MLILVLLLWVAVAFIVAPVAGRMMSGTTKPACSQRRHVRLIHAHYDYEREGR